MISRLIEFQKNQRQQIIEKLNAAQAAIEQELENLGYYPENGGRLNAKELFRRAGIGASTLKNPTHENTRASVKRWLTRTKAKGTPVGPRSAKGNDATQLERSIALLAQEFDTFKLEYERLEARCAVLETDNDSLRAENEKLRAEAMKVINIKGGPTNPQPTFANVVRTKP